MKKHPEERCEEAWIEWTRKRFPTKLPNDVDLEIETEAERETGRDLSKPIPQLLCDFHDQAERALRGASQETKLLLNAHKRMVGMMAQVAMENRNVATWMLWLTVAIVALTVVLVIKEVWPMIAKAIM